MKIRIDEARKLSIKILKRLGFTQGDTELITGNLIDGGYMLKGK